MPRRGPGWMEPVWVSRLPAAAGLWRMILAFRERGSHEVADSLQAALEQQWEVHCRTEQLLGGRSSAPACDPSPATSPRPRLDRAATRGSGRTTVSASESDSSEERRAGPGAGRDRCGLAGMFHLYF